MKALLAGLILAALVNSSPPVLGDPEARGFAQCADESILMIEAYPNGYAFYRQGSETPFAFTDKVNKEVYVFSFKKWYPIDDAMKQWPSPCDIPGGTGV